MKVSSTYDRKRNDHINRANMARICSAQLGIKEVSASLYRIAAPVSEIAMSNKDGKQIYYRDEIEEAIPWNERSMRTFGVVYRYESIASFIGIDGKTYIVPNDQPVLDHLQECGYTIAPNGTNLDGTTSDDGLIVKDGLEIVVDRNLSVDIVKQIDEMENDRPYYRYCQSYASVVRFGGTFGLYTASEEEIQGLSLSERKVANICTYGRTLKSQPIDDYVKFALHQYYLDEQNFTAGLIN